MRRSSFLHLNNDVFNPMPFIVIERLEKAKLDCLGGTFDGNTRYIDYIQIGFFGCHGTCPLI
jgi:hypothetical protein